MAVKIREVGVPMWMSEKYGILPALKVNNKGEPTKDRARGYAVVERKSVKDREYKVLLTEYGFPLEYMDAQEIVEDLAGADMKEHQKALMKKVEALPYKNVLPLQGFIEEEMDKAITKLGLKPGTDLTMSLELTEDYEVVIRIGPKLED